MTTALTSLSHGAGCGCKLSAADLRPILAGLPRPDDPRVLVAAANALSDVYAMGGTPVSALNLVAYPLETLGPDVLREILRGGADAAAAAGASIVGGHSIDDPEPKYGLAVTGT